MSNNDLVYQTARNRPIDTLMLSECDIHRELQGQDAHTSFRFPMLVCVKTCIEDDKQDLMLAILFVPCRGTR